MMDKYKIKSDNFEDMVIDLSIQLKNKNREINAVFKHQYEFLKELTHNLKNPLGNILSFSDMILDDIENLSPELMSNYLSIINKSAQYSIKCLNAISKFSWLQSKNPTFNFENKNYNYFLNEIIAKYQPKASEKKIILKTDFTDSNENLSIDIEELGTAIENILSNSIRFSPSNTTVTISIINDNDFVKTTIKDEGIGVSENNIPKLFDTFYVVNTYTKEREKCIGLGLPIAQKIIQYHNGSISFNSHLERGSCVEIILKK